MKVSDFDYQLPPELIAQYPTEQRTDSRLLQLTADGQLTDLVMPDIVAVLRAGDLLVLNDTRVIPARMYGRKQSGGKVEVLLERIIDDHHFIAQVRASKSPKAGQPILIAGDESTPLTVTGREGSFFKLQSSQSGELIKWLDKVGHMPLPPYIERDDEIDDQERYQTVYARHQGAVAAPTAGLHYDQDLLDRLASKGIQIETVTLHVGAGTYQPVRVDQLDQHIMHRETIDVGQTVCDAILTTREQGGRIVAVGTTVVRSLETAAREAQNQLIEPYSGETDIFIYPGYQFNIIDMLQTNFHLPESTLLMLVSAFSGHNNIMAAYRHAIQQQYRFFSYGDAMLLQRVS